MLLFWLHMFPKYMFQHFFLARKFHRPFTIFYCKNLTSIITKKLNFSCNNNLLSSKGCLHGLGIGREREHFLKAKSERGHTTGYLYYTNKKEWCLITEGAISSHLCYRSASEMSNSEISAVVKFFKTSLHDFGIFSQ